MGNKKNFLIGFGERLTEKIAPPPSMVEKNHPYTFVQAQKRLSPKVLEAVKVIQALPTGTTPQNKAVAVITMHPTYVAKSYYPNDFLKSFNLEAIGSRSLDITPEEWGKKNHPDFTQTTEIFVAGSKDSFANLATQLPNIASVSPGAKDIIKIEDFRIVTIEEKLKKITSEAEEILFEIVLHASGLPKSEFILEGFKNYVESLGVKLDLDRRLHADGLCFLPLRVKKDVIKEVAKYSFLRLAREMPRLRPIARSGSTVSFKCDMPTSNAVDPTIKVAIFDGGIPDVSPISKWANSYAAPNISNPVNGYIDHGMGVTSAFLFGPLKDGEPLERPFANVDHYRVLDDKLKNDDIEFDVLVRIRDILKSRQYEFVNLSLGPDLPIEDNDVHAWTAVLDEILSKGNILATVAAGNSGEKDWPSGNARIQSPADCVNALSVGASDTDKTTWKRAKYSSIGPGRSPGVVKPDVLAFGGSSHDLFWMLDSNKFGFARPDMGTSFSAPFALRTAVGIRSYFGTVLSPLALKALLIHSAQSNAGHKHEVGWGKIPSEIAEIVLTDDNTARVVFQGTLSPAEWVKFPIPIPAEEITGRVKISATLCFSSITDPQDPVNYTRSGLEIVFRPHEDVRKREKQVYPQSKSFFKAKDLYGSTDSLRHDAHRWETTLSTGKSMLGKSLKNPTFNIHYNARDGGNVTDSGLDIPYALVITVEAPKHANLYNKIINRYRTHLEILKPVVQVPILT